MNSSCHITSYGFLWIWWLYRLPIPSCHDPNDDIWSYIGLETNVWHSRVREHSRVRSSFVSNRFCSNVTTTCIHKYLWADLIVISFKISCCTYDLAHFEHNSIYVSFQMNVIDTLTKLKRTFAFKLYFICVWYGKS